MTESAATSPPDAATQRWSRPHCPLCEAGAARVVARCAVPELLRAWRVLGVELSPAALEVFEGRTAAELFECHGCGFRYFDLTLAGSGRFYSELQKQQGTYYAADRAEFSWTLDQAARFGLRQVLDVGCGTGAFLDLARGRGFETFGLELNPTAAEAAREKGHQLFSFDLAGLAAWESHRRFDLITIFQVLEHVSNPLGVVRDALRLLRPQGCLALGVPHEKFISRLCPWDPHQWPPHHVTRWRRRDLPALGRRCGLEVVSTGGDRVVGGEARHFWDLHNRLARELGRPAHRGGEWLPGALSFVYRKAGLKHIFPRVGPSIYALFRVPGGAAGA